MVVVLSSWHFQNSDGSSNFWVTTPTARRSKARDIGAQKHTSSSIDLSVTHPLSCSQRWEEELLIMLQRARHLTHQDHRSRLPLVAMFALDSRFHVIQFAFILSPSQTRWVTLCIVESVRRASQFGFWSQSSGHSISVRAKRRSKRNKL